jgi:hypothetical protein
MACRALVLYRRSPTRMPAGRRKGRRGNAKERFAPDAIGAVSRPLIQIWRTGFSQLSPGSGRGSLPLAMSSEDAMARELKPMLNGRELSKGELEVIRRHLEGVDTISGISDDMLALITQYWPDQLVKIKPPNTAN